MPYIKKCLDSILEQTFQDFKIIIVDDMSTDLSDKFCEMYSRKYPDKIVFIRLSEKGYAGKCRNVGIDYNLEHTYTWFIDSDDYVYDKNVLQHVYDIAKENNFPQLIRGKCVLQKGIRKCEQMPEISIEKMINQGAAPWRNFVYSQVQMPYFAENRQNLMM